MPMNKLCPACGQSYNRYGKTCSKKCSNDLKRREKVDLWLEGKHDGMRGKTSTARFIRQYMLEKADYKCQKCGWSEVNSFTGKIPLELSHKDGDFTNNNPDNLEIICPNCHSLTESHKGANKKAGRPRSKYYRGL